MSMYVTGMIIVSLLLAATIAKHYRNPDMRDLIAILIVSAIAIPLSWFSLGAIIGWTAATSYIAKKIAVVIRDVSESEKEGSDDRTD